MVGKRSFEASINLYKQWPSCKCKTFWKWSGESWVGIIEGDVWEEGARERDDGFTDPGKSRHGDVIGRRDGNG